MIYFYCREECYFYLKYYIPSSDEMTWTKLFGIMENNKTYFHIESFSITQAPLEQVFLSFTKYQIDHYAPKYRQLGKVNIHSIGN